MKYHVGDRVLLWATNKGLIDFYTRGYKSEFYITALIVKANNHRYDILTLDGSMNSNIQYYSIEKFNQVCIDSNVRLFKHSYIYTELTEIAIAGFAPKRRCQGCP